MSYSVEKLLADARCLVNRLKDHDTSVDNLISHAQTLNKRVDAMKQYQEDLNELNEIARHKPPSSVIMNLLQENTQIRELQQENRDLRMALEEHQSAVELIMSKYREQIVKLLLANKLDKRQAKEPVQRNKELEEKIEKINEMLSVMQQAVSIDDRQQVRDQQLMSQLKLENNTLREVLHIAVSQGEFYQPSTSETPTQTDSDEDALAMFDSVNLDSSVITVKELNMAAGSSSSTENKDNEVTSESQEDSASKESSPESVKENVEKSSASDSPKKNEK